MWWGGERDEQLMFSLFIYFELSYGTEGGLYVKLLYFQMYTTNQTTLMDYSYFKTYFYHYKYKFCREELG